MSVNFIALAGGLFALLAFNHFVVDWIFQTHAEAMAKSHDARVRARHCLIYAIGFIPVFLLLHLAPVEDAAYLVILFVSHFWEDTYRPVIWWMKHLRRHPDFAGRDDIEAFKQIIASPLGVILMITVDQIVHLAFIMLIAVGISVRLGLAPVWWTLR
jgi:hypothetical protein